MTSFFYTGDIMITIEKFNVFAMGTQVGNLIIKYHDVFIKCRLKVFKKQKLWIVMPELWSSKTEKCRIVFWPTQELSDDFQKKVLDQLAEKFQMNIEKAQKLLAEQTKVKKKNKMDTNK